MDQKGNTLIHQSMPPWLQQQLRFVLVRYGGGIVQMSGSIAGDTHARNKYGNYIRARTTPVNPNSARQTACRARIQLLSEAWSDELSNANRIAWAAYAAAVAWNNKLGETIKLSGFNHFVRSNAAYLQVTPDRIVAGPTVMALPSGDPQFAVALSEANGITVTFDENLPWTTEGGAGMMLHIGTPQNPTRTFFAGPWRYHGWIGGTIPGPTASPDGPTPVTCYTLTEGQRVWVKANIIRADGRLSTKFTAASVLVGA